jgi:hypothetical protein
MSSNCETQTNINSNIMTQCLVINARLDKRIGDQCRSSKSNERLTRIVR